MSKKIYATGREGIEKLIDKLRSKYSVTAPVKDLNGRTRFKELADKDEVELTDISVLPAKIQYFKSIEETIRYNNIEGKVDEIKDETKTVLFGARPCDLKSIQWLDEFYSQEYEDPYYLKRRGNSVVVGLACSQPGPYCFCTSLGYGPTSSEGSDLFLTEVDGSYMVEVLTKMGEGVVKENKELLRELKDDLREKVEKDYAKRVQRKIDLEAVNKNIDKKFSGDFWTNVAAPCVSCGLCNYLCPSCSCFDVSDESSVFEDQGVRLRLWDSCQRPGYSLMTGGENPRERKEDRLKNRVYCKFGYNGKVTCFGCGRCTQYCPADIDLIEILSMVSEK